MTAQPQIAVPSAKSEAMSWRDHVQSCCDAYGVESFSLEHLIDMQRSPARHDRTAEEK